MKLIFRLLSKEAIGIKEKKAYSLKGKFKNSMLSDIRGFQQLRNIVYGNPIGSSC